MIKMNKRGEKLFSIWWFIILIIIGVGIVSGVSLFYSYNLDVRFLESDLLAGKVLKCISNPEGISPLVLEEDFDLYGHCGISQSVLESGKYFVKIEIKDFFDDSNLTEHKFGNNAFEKDCEIKSKLIAQNYPECSRKSVYVVNEGDKKYLVSVLAASNYRGGKNSNEQTN